MAPRMSRKKVVAVVAAAAGLSLAVSACGDSDTESSGRSTGPECAAYSQYGELTGKEF